VYAMLHLLAQKLLRADVCAIRSRTTRHGCGSSPERLNLVVSSGN